MTQTLIQHGTNVGVFQLSVHAFSVLAVRSSLRFWTRTSFAVSKQIRSVRRPIDISARSSVKGNEVLGELWCARSRTMRAYLDRSIWMSKTRSSASSSLGYHCVKSALAGGSTVRQTCPRFTSASFYSCRFARSSSIASKSQPSLPLKLRIVSQ